jgi:hypothetical protein
LLFSEQKSEVPIEEGAEAIGPIGLSENDEQPGSDKSIEEHEQNPGKSSCSSVLRGEFLFRLTARWPKR